MGVKIKDLPVDDRPIERMISNGAKALTNEELLAIIIKTGTKNSSSKELAGTILSKIKDIKDVSNLRINNLITIKGIGINKASTILASIELGSRLNNNIKTINNTTFNNANTIYNYYKNILKNEKQEYFYVIYLNKKLKIIDNKMLFKGTVDYSLVHPREIFKEAYLLSANYIICIHNHPTGNTLPSNDDFNITKNIKSVGEILGVYLIDHIIIGTNNYYSFKENNDI